MRRRAVGFGLCALALWTWSCGGDAQTPLTPLERIIEAAKTGDPTGLAELCDPEGRVDSDARRICDANPEDERGWALFRAWFADAQIGKMVRHDQSDAGVVIVKLSIGPDGRTAEATVVQRGDRWYLSEL